jgi:hypothetical protein
VAGTVQRHRLAPGVTVDQEADMIFTGTGYLLGGGPKRGPLKNRPGPRTRLHIVVNGVAICGAKPRCE